MVACGNNCTIILAGPFQPPTLFELCLEAVLREDPKSIEHLGLLPQEKLLPTVMVVIVICTALVGACFYGIGRAKMTRLVQYLPVCVLNGFLGCIGYKTMDEAVLIATGYETYHQPGTLQFWKLFLPAVPIGTCMYFMKKWHIGLVRGS